MHAASSVSELYAADEVDLLLDEIRHLEPTSCRPEELQDLEIAGSGCAGWEGVTPGTERSWDSHAGYRAAAAGAARSLAPLYCSWRRLASLVGITGALVAIIGLVVVSLALAGAGRGGSLAPPVLAGRLRALQLAGLWAALAHAALVFAHVSRLADLLPIKWHLLTGVVSACSALGLLATGAGSLAGVLAQPAPAPELLAAASVSICGSGCALVLLGASVRGARARGAGPRAAAYRAVPPRPPDALP